MANFTLDLFRLGEHGATDIKGVSLSETRRRLLVDLHDAHAAADIGVCEGTVNDSFGQRIIMDADEEARLAGNLALHVSCGCRRANSASRG
jgi:hypothetical protein